MIAGFWTRGVPAYIVTTYISNARKPIRGPRIHEISESRQGRIVEAKKDDVRSFSDITVEEVQAGVSVDTRDK